MPKRPLQEVRMSDDEIPPGPRYNYPEGWDTRPLDPEIQKQLDLIQAKYPITEEVMAEEEELFCTCLKPEDGRKMIECSNKSDCRLWWYQLVHPLSHLWNTSTKYPSYECMKMTDRENPGDDGACALKSQAFVASLTPILDWFCDNCIRLNINGVGGHINSWKAKSEGNKQRKMSVVEKKVETAPSPSVPTVHTTDVTTPAGDAKPTTTSYLCPLCLNPYSRPYTIKIHFPTCEKKNPNPKGLKWDDYQSVTNLPKPKSRRVSQPTLGTFHRTSSSPIKKPASQRISSAPEPNVTAPKTATSRTANPLLLAATRSANPLLSPQSSVQGSSPILPTPPTYPSPFSSIAPCQPPEEEEIHPISLDDIFDLTANGSDPLSRELDHTGLTDDDDDETLSDLTTAGDTPSPPRAVVEERILRGNPIPFRLSREPSIFQAGPADHTLVLGSCKGKGQRG